MLLADGLQKRLKEIDPSKHSRQGLWLIAVIPLFHTGPESHELTRFDKYLDSWLNRTQFVKIFTDSRSP